MVKEKFSMEIFLKESFLTGNVSTHKSHIMIKIIMKDKCLKISFMAKELSKINKESKKDCLDMVFLFLEWLIFLMEFFIKDLYKTDKNLVKVLLKNLMDSFTLDISNMTDSMVLDRFVTLISRLILASLKMDLKMEKVI